jgi:hypothetical protein
MSSRRALYAAPIPMGEDIQTDSVFLSHSEEDAITALKLALRLEQRGFYVWTYEVSSVTGQPYSAQAAMAIRTSRTVVLLVSRAAFASASVAAELSAALDAKVALTPVLSGLGHEDLRIAKPEWFARFGTSVGESLDQSSLDTIADRLAGGLRASNVSPQPPRASRIGQLTERIERLEDAERIRRDATDRARQSDPVFLSHAQEDALAALKLALRLEQRGFYVWTYEVSSVTGRPYPEQAAAAIRRSRAVVLLVSRPASASGPVEDEVSVALEAKLVLIPVLSGLSYEDLRTIKPDWLKQFGTNVGESLAESSLEIIADRLAEALRTSDVSPQPLRTIRLGQLTEKIERLEQAERTKGEAADRARLEVENRRVEAERLERERRQRRRNTQLVLAVPVLALAVIAILLASKSVAILEVDKAGTTPVPDVMARDTRSAFVSATDKSGYYAISTDTLLGQGTKLDRYACLLWARFVVRPTLEIENKNVRLSATVGECQFPFARPTEHPVNPVQGPDTDLIEPRLNVLTQYLEVLRIPISAEMKATLNATVRALARTTTDSLYNEFSEIDAPTHDATASLRPLIDALPFFTARAALAQGPPNDVMAQALALLRQYKDALEAHDAARVAAAYASHALTQRQRDAIEDYLYYADPLTVNIVPSNPTMTPEGTIRMVVTRTDTFIDRRTTRPQTLTVTLEATIVQEGGAWKLSSLKRVG